MTARSQIPLDLPLPPPAHGPGDFIVSPSNRAAFDAVSRFDWPANSLLLTGPAGSGKSHLAAIWAERNGAEIHDARVVTAALAGQVIGKAAIIVEDVSGLSSLDGARKQDCEAGLFHLINLARAEDVPLLMTGRGLAARWPVSIPDLASRLQAMTQVAIGEPDDALLSSILSKMFADRQMRVSADVIAYLCNRMERTFAAAVDIVARLDRDALVQKRPITVPLARQMLDGHDDAEAST